MRCDAQGSCEQRKQCCDDVRALGFKLPGMKAGGAQDVGDQGSQSGIAISVLQLANNVPWKAVPERSERDLEKDDVGALLRRAGILLIPTVDDEVTLIPRQFLTIVPQGCRSRFHQANPQKIAALRRRSIDRQANGRNGDFV